MTSAGVSPSPSAPVIHLNGWPGCGKLTIARALTHLLGAQLLHNHLMLDAAGAVFHRGTQGHARLRAEVTGLLISAATTLPPDIPIIVTNALAETPGDHLLLAPFRQLANARNAPFIPVTLDISAAQNQRRLTDPSRAAHAKLTDVAYLNDLRARYTLLSFPNEIRLDVTHLTARQAAEHIEHLVGDYNPVTVKNA